MPVESPMRILVASPLGAVIEPTLSATFTGSTVKVAVDPATVRQYIANRVRFDVVLADLIWNNPSLELTFDGLDVLDILRCEERQAAVLLAAQGHTMEHDHLDEARLRPAEAVGIYLKSSGVPPLLDAIREAAVGRRSDLKPLFRPRSLYEFFGDRRGTTAGRLAGAIAAGRASDTSTLATAARVGINTANKVTSAYLGPIIEQRGEHDPDLPMTVGVVYRWCGLHARYIVSWCRRNGHEDVLQFGR